MFQNAFKVKMGTEEGKLDKTRDFSKLQLLASILQRECWTNICKRDYKHLVRNQSFLRTAEACVVFLYVLYSVIYSNTVCFTCVFSFMSYYWLLNLPFSYSDSCTPETISRSMFILRNYDLDYYSCEHTTTSLEMVSHLSITTTLRPCRFRPF